MLRNRVQRGPCFVHVPTANTTDVNQLAFPSLTSSQKQLGMRNKWEAWNFTSGFTSTTSARYLTENHLTGIPEGHKRLILNMASWLRTPVRNLERPKTVFPLSSEKSPASKSPAKKKLPFVLATQALNKNHKRLNMKPAFCAQRLDENDYLMGRDSSKKNATL